MVVCVVASRLDLLRRAVEHSVSDVVPLFHALPRLLLGEAEAMAMRALIAPQRERLRKEPSRLVLAISLLGSTLPCHSLCTALEDGILFSILTWSRMIRYRVEMMTAPLTNGSLNQRKVALHTLTGLKRWSCHSRELPRKLLESPAMAFTEQEAAVNQVKALHVYDFDNTC